MTVALYVRVELKPGTRDKYVARVTEHQRNVLANEPYCQRFDLLIPEGTDDVVCLYEVYDDEASLKAHGETPYFSEYRDDTGIWVADRTRTQLTVVE